MNLRIVLLIASLLFISCSSDSDKKLELLDGYWNIDTVTLPDGSEKEFPFSNHMDHFEVEGLNGVKHRVSPTYDGGFVNYGSPVYFKWQENEDELILIFKEGDNSYQQSVEEVTTTDLELKHENGTIYSYKRYTSNEE